MSKYFSCNGKSYYIGGDNRHVYESLTGKYVGYVNEKGYFYGENSELKGRLSNVGVQSWSGGYIGQKYGWEWKENDKSASSSELDIGKALVGAVELTGLVIYGAAKLTCWTAKKISNGVDKGLEKLENHIKIKNLERDAQIHSIVLQLQKEGKTGFIIKDNNFGFEVLLYNNSLGKQFSKVNVINKDGELRYKLDNKGNVLNIKKGKPIYKLNEEGNVVDLKQNEVGIQLGDSPFIKKTIDKDNCKQTRSLL